MGVAADILRSLRHGPRPVMREHLARGPQEARTFAFLMTGCLLVVLAQLPSLARDASLGPGGALVTPLARSVPPELLRLDVLLAYTMLAWLFFAPLVFFGLALLAHGLSRLLGGRGESWGARLALFWSWLAASPLALLSGLLGGLTGSAALTNVTGVVWIAVFAAFWVLSQREAALAPDAHAA